MNLYVCLRDGHWRFYEDFVHDFLKEVDGLPPQCPGCKQPMHRVDPVDDRLALKGKPEEKPE